MLGLFLGSITFLKSGKPTLSLRQEFEQTKNKAIEELANFVSELRIANTKFGNPLEDTVRLLESYVRRSFSVSSHVIPSMIAVSSSPRLVVSKSFLASARITVYRLPRYAIKGDGSLRSNLHHGKQAN